MLYLRSFSLPGSGRESAFLDGSAEARRTCYGSHYPFGVFLRKEVPPLESETVTLLCGANGSGKTTLLNLIGEKLGLRRGTPLNRTSFLPDYLAMCQADTAPAFRSEVRKQS